jgi:peptide/nickel transport system substrate-binding protein
MVAQDEALTRRLSRRRLIGTAAMATAGLAVAAACGGKETSSNPGAGRSAGKEEKPRKGGTLIGAQVSDVNMGTGYPFVLLAENPFLNYLPVEPLVRYRNSLEPEMVLAERLEYNADRTKAVITLKPGLTFHNGAPVTPEDYFFGIDLILNPRKYGITGSFQLAGFARFITDMKKVDARTMEFTFDRPRANMTDLFAQLPVVHAASYEDVKNGKAVAGTGPYIFKEWAPGQRLVFTANPNWHLTDREGGPYLDGVEVRFFADQDAMGLAYEAGGLDLILDAPATLAKRYRARTRVGPKRGLVYAGLNVTSPLLRDSRVRRALFLAVDRERFVNELGEGFGTVTVQPWPSSSPAFNPALEASFYDPEKAKQLLKEAGFSQSRPLVIEHRTTQTYVNIASVLKENFEAIGVRAELKGTEATAFLAKLRAREFQDVWVTAHAFSDLTPVTNFQQTFPYQVPNPSFYENPTYLDIIEKLSGIDPLSDEAKRQYERFTQLWLTDPWLLPLQPTVPVALLGAKVRGFDEYFLAPGGSPNFGTIWKAP